MGRYDHGIVRRRVRAQYGRIDDRDDAAEHHSGNEYRCTRGAGWPGHGAIDRLLHSAAAAGTDLDLNLNIKIADNAAHCPNLVSNGTFGSDTVWTKGAGWTIGTGVATSDGSQTAVSDLEQTLSNLTDGITFAVSFDLTRTAGSVTPILGGTAGTTRSSSATHAENIIAGSADDKIILRASDDFQGTVDNVTVTASAGTGTITGTLKVIWMNAGDIA